MTVITSLLNDHDNERKLVARAMRPTIMKCIYCQGKMERGIAPFHVDRNGYHLVLDRIPAWLCSQCGEVYFDETEVDSIQAMLGAVDEQVEKIAVPA